MHECSLTHNPRRRRDSSGDAHGDVVQLLIGEFDRLRGWSAINRDLGLEGPKLINDRRDCVFAARLYDSGACKLVGINVADQAPQRLKMLMTRAGLIVLFDEWDRQFIYSPSISFEIIGSDSGERKPDLENLFTTYAVSSTM